MVKLRLKRLGRKKRPYYRIVAMDATSPRDGQALEEIGMYDPLHSKVEVDEDATLRWLKAGARMTGTVQALLKNQGLLARWRGIEGTATEGFLTLDKPKRQKKLAAADAAATTPTVEAEDTSSDAPVATDEPAAAAPEAEASDAGAASPAADDTVVAETAAPESEKPSDEGDSGDEGESAKEE